MAIRTLCPRCGKRFTAPDDYLGKKVDCPRCAHRLVLRTKEEHEEIRREEEQDRQRVENDRRKLEMLERIEREKLASGASPSGQPYYERFQTGLHAVRSYHPNEPSRFLRLRALSDVFIIAAYGVLMLVALGMALTIYSGVQGVLSVPWLLLALAGQTVLGIVLFLGMKLVGELVFLFAEVGDAQSDLVRLLLDVREGIDALQGKGLQEDSE